MSELKIDYGDLASAARAARSAASSCRSYQSALERKVSGKLDNLEKGHSGYTSNASYLARQKMSQLSRKAERYDRYSQKLEDFSDKASTTDANVARSMRADAQNFRKRNDMEVGAVEAFFTWLSTTIINSNDFARWLKDAFTDLGNFLDDAWDAVKYWYNCEGGKYIVNAIISTVLVAVAAVVLVCVAWPALLAASGFWALTVALAGFIGAAITLVDRFVALTNDVRAYLTHGEDPAWAQRYDNMNSTVEWLQKENFDSSFIDRLSYKLADAINVVSAVCAAINLADIGVTFSRLFKDPAWINKWNRIKSGPRRNIFQKASTKTGRQTIRRMINQYKKTTTSAQLEKLAKTKKMKNIKKYTEAIDKWGGYVYKYTSKGPGETISEMVKDHTYRKSSAIKNMESIMEKLRNIRQPAFAH